MADFPTWGGGLMKFDDTANMRADEETKAATPLDPKTKGGKMAGGTINIAVSAEVIHASDQAVKTGEQDKTPPVQSHTDDKV